jgi:tetratricopeptide (TPR) repeat protein
MNRALFGERHRESLRTEDEQATLLIAIDRPKDAEVLLREAVSLNNDSSSSAAVFRAELRSHLGYSLYQQGKYREARELIEPALAEQRRLLGNVHLQTLWSIRALASTLRDVGELDRAESLYREAVGSSHLLYGDDHSQTEITEGLLLLQLQRTGKYAEAEQLARTRLPRNVRNYGQRDPRTATWRGRLGSTLLDEGQIAEAEVLLRSTLADWRALYPAGHQDEMDWANRLAYITTLRGAPDADPMYQTAVALRARKPADQPDYVTDGIHYLAWAMNAHGDVGGAERLYRTALDLYRRVLPPDHPYIAFTQAGLERIRTSR